MMHKISLLWLLVWATACIGQQNSKNMKTQAMLCDPEKGLCEINIGEATGEHDSTASATKPVKIIYFTDPICSSCWGIEPQLRKLKLQYGSSIEIEYRMGGLLPDWSYNSGGISKPSDVAHHWDEVSQHYDMPIDGDVWLEDPLPSSFPPSIAFKAAQRQDPAKAILFLRRIREMVFLEKKNITKWEFLAQAAQETGLDAQQLKADCEGPAQKDFQEDLALARNMGVRGFPTFFFTDQEQNRLTVYGVKPYATFEKTLLQLLPEAPKQDYDTSLEGLLHHYASLSAKEYAELSGLSREEAEKRLRNAPGLKAMATKNGTVWKKG